jgi:hypothetical protein
MSSDFWKSLFWSPLVRAPIVIACFLLGYAFSRHLPVIAQQSNPTLVLQVLSEVARSNIEDVSRPEFAYALSSEIVSAAVGLAFAYLVAYVLVIKLLLFVARRQISAQKTMQNFETNFSTLSEFLSKDPLLGDAWTAFGRTCVRENINDKDHYFATSRPQVFFNAGLAREHLFGLKLMPNIPGYFVGLGLLLTFIGSGRGGGRPPPPPQIRTCSFSASGSSDE